MEEQNVTRVCKVCGREFIISQFHRTARGVTHVCKECVKNRRLETKNNKDKLADFEQRIEEIKNAKLESFSPRDLMAELHRRGYE